MSKPEKSIVEYDGPVARIYLRGGHSDIFTIVDRGDAELLRLTRWYLHTGGYASRCIQINGRTHSILMHRVVAGATTTQQVDHINGNKLDNRRANLQICSQSINVIKSRKYSKPTTSQYRGVNRMTGSELWDCRITIDGQWYRLGLFRDEDVAGAIAGKARNDYFSNGTLPSSINQTRNKRLVW